MTPSSIVEAPPSPARPLDGVRLGLWDHVSFTVAHTIVRWLMACLSLSGLYRFGRMFGTLEWLTNFKRRRRFAAALRHVLDHEPTVKERRRLTREFFMRQRCDRIFYLVFDCIPRDKALSLLSIGNQALLDETVARGGGVQLALAHHGPVHVMGMLLALKGYKPAGIRAPHEGALRKYVQDRFDRLYPEFRRTRMLSSDSFPRDIYRCLREGYLTASSMDVSRIHGPNKRVEEVTIFGQKRPFLSGPLWIAMRCRAPVLQVFVIPGEAFCYRLEVVEMLLDPVEVEDEAEAVSRAMRIYAANIEKYTRASPSLISRV